MPFISTKDLYSTGKQMFKDTVKTGGQVVKFFTPKQKKKYVRGNFKKTYNNIMPRNLNLYTQHGGKVVERKYVDGSFNYYAQDLISTTSDLINEVAEGTGVDQRVGRRIENRTVSFRMNITSPADFSSRKVRVLVVMDRQPNGTQFTVADLFENATYPADSHYDLSNRNRFHVYYDKMFMMNPISGTQVSRRVLNFGINFGGQMTTYSDTGGVIANIATNSIYVVVCGDAPNAGQNSTKPLVDCVWRFRYYDA